MSLAEFLAFLDGQRLSYHLDRVRAAVMVVVAVPGERWEVEFMDGGGVEVERFRSDGKISGPESLAELSTFAD